VRSPCNHHPKSPKFLQTMRANYGCKLVEAPPLSEGCDLFRVWSEASQTTVISLLGRLEFVNSFEGQWWPPRREETGRQLRTHRQDVPISMPAPVRSRRPTWTQWGQMVATASQLEPAGARPEGRRQRAVRGVSRRQRADDLWNACRYRRPG